MIRRVCYVVTICLLALSALRVGAQEPPQRGEALAKKYAPFLGEQGAREYLQGLRFQVRDFKSETFELRVRGERYQVELLALLQFEDCEACPGQLDALVFRDGQPFFVEKSLAEGSGWNGNPYWGDERKVLPLARGIDGLVFTGEMWMPRGCHGFTAELLGIDVEARQIKQIFADGAMACDGDPEVGGVEFVAAGLDAAGRGRFVFTVISQQRHRRARVNHRLRFEPGQWKLVKDGRAAARRRR